MIGSSSFGSTPRQLALTTFDWDLNYNLKVKLSLNWDFLGRGEKKGNVIVKRNKERKR